MEEEKKAAAGVDWVEKAPAAPRRRSRKKPAAKGKPKKPAAPAEPKQEPAVSDTPETPAETAPARGSGRPAARRHPRITVGTP